MNDRQGRFLNAILTVNAILLGVLLWTQFANHPPVVDSASAQSRTKTPLPNSGRGVYAAQSHNVKILRDLEKAVNSIQSTLESGRMRVEVVNLDEIEIVSQ